MTETVTAVRRDIYWDPNLIRMDALGIDYINRQCFLYGRCRSGKRWFWTAADTDTITSHDQSCEHHGWADTEEDALAKERQLDELPPPPLLLLPPLTKADSG